MAIAEPLRAFVSRMGQIRVIDCVVVNRELRHIFVPTNRLNRRRGDRRLRIGTGSGRVRKIVVVDSRDDRFRNGQLAGGRLIGDVLGVLGDVRRR